jgi:hypothetical protein
MDCREKQFEGHDEKSDVRPSERHAAMDANLKIYICTAIILLLSTAVVTRAGTRELVFPMPDGVVSLLPEQFAFSSDGHIGFALVYTRTHLSARLFSFSVDENRVVDEFDLAPDFGVGSTPLSSPLISLKVHSEAGIIVIYGADASNTQTLLALSFDAGGHLRKLWIRQFPVFVLAPSAAELAYNKEGTNIYLTYYASSLQPTLSEDKTLRAVTRQMDRGQRSITLSRQEAVFNRGFSPQGLAVANTRHLALIHTADGAVVTTVPLSFSDEYASVFFNEERNQLIALASGTLYVFKPGSDSLELESKIERNFDIPGVSGVGISQDSRFLIAYGGYTPLTNKSGVNNYAVYDLELKTSRAFRFDGKLFAISNDLTFHKATGRIIAPMKVRARETKDGTIAIVIGGFRVVDILSLSSDGTLVRTSQIELPERSPGTATVNGLLPFNNAVVSQTGAIAFVASGNGHVGRQRDSRHNFASATRLEIESFGRKYLFHKTT